MKKSVFIMYSGYIWTKTLVGLTFEPYRSIKETIERPILIPVIFTPFLGVILLFIAGKLGSLLIQFYGLQREFVALFLSTTLLSILFWQGLLLYLFINFLLVSAKKK